LLGQSIDYENEVNDDESQDEQIEEDEGQDEYRYDWMQFAEMGPKVIIQRNSDLRSRDMDHNHDWINAG
jgi:hypothetical protein